MMGGDKISLQTVIMREMTAEDVQAALFIEERGSDFPWKNRSSFEGPMGEGNAFVADYAGEVCAFLVVKSEEGRRLMLSKMAVHPAYRRQGLGNLLLRHAEARALDTEHDCVVLSVRESNAAARALYERAGYQEEDRVPGYYKKTGVTPAEKTAIRMLKRLES